MSDLRTFAFYLPQFHPIPENNLWHGEGFTEWTNVGKAKPLFSGHYQPKVPADLGYYDLRVEETREKQAELARYAGIEGFVYWHYWFGGGKKLLEKPIYDVLTSKKPSFPFCFAWANDSWKGIWHGTAEHKMLIEQTYPGKQDVIDHFYHNLPYFQDERYIKIDDKPLFMIYKPLDLPESNFFIEIWNELAIKNGLKGIFFVGQAVSMSEVPLMRNIKLDAINIVRLGYAEQKIQNRYFRYFKRFLKLPRVVDYKDIYKYFVGEEELDDFYLPTIIPNWDHSPRSGTHALILHNSNPQVFEKHLTSVVNILDAKSANRKVAFVKSWNEWAEGNYLEPDLRYGKGYLEVFRKILINGER